MKVLIPVAGAGTTLRPHTHTQPKPLIPVAGKPILGHIVDYLVRAGMDDFVFVVGYMGDKIRNFIQDNYSDRFRFSFVNQEPRLGIGHAIWLCREVLEDKPVLIAFGDTIIDVDINRVLASPESVVCVQEVEDPRLFGVALLNDEGYLRSVSEKPSIPKSNLAMVGMYKLQETPRLISALDNLINSQQKTHGEFQLTDALMQLIKEGVKIRTLKVNNWFDCGKRESLIEINRILLDRMETDSLPEFPNTVLVPPVYLSRGCKIQDSVIGPNVAVGEYAQIKDSIIQNSILGDYSRLESIVLKSSILGNDSILVGRSHSVNIGDNTEIDFNS
jgi:glucose-1-phosphate thymidylyltransferase